MIRIVAVLIAGLALGCTHAHRSPMSLEQALRLDLALETIRSVSEEKVRVKSSLRNVSPAAVELCQLDGGVTIMAIVGERTVPLLGSGAVTDAPCYNGGMLPPGGTRMFDDEVPLWPGTTAIRSSIRVHRPGQSSSEIRSRVPSRAVLSLARVPQVSGNVSRTTLNHTDYFRTLRTQGRSQDEALSELQRTGASLLDCIRAIHEVEGIGLGTAKRLVCESPIWSAVHEKTVTQFIEELDQRDRELLAILRIGHDTSMRGEGLSLRDALTRTRYRELRQEFQESDLLRHLQADASLVDEWLAYSEDKRTEGGWFLLRTALVGQIRRPAESIQFSSLENAVAAYVIRELDFWASIAPA
jgi:hypothetical protein